MYLKNIEIVNFRNIDKICLDFNKNVNIFIGKNAQGKTSILDSIYVLAFSKSSKGILEDELVKKDKHRSGFPCGLSGCLYGFHNLTGRHRFLCVPKSLHHAVF